MSTKAISGVGVEFHRWNGSTWESISEITSIKGPGMKRETIEVTNIDSTGGWKEYITGFKDAGTISLSMNFSRGNLDQFMADFDDPNEQYYEIVIPDTDMTTIEFTGLVTEVPLNISAKEAITNDVTIQLTGKPVVNSGAFSGSPSSW